MCIVRQDGDSRPQNCGCILASTSISVTLAQCRRYKGQVQYWQANREYGARRVLGSVTPLADLHSLCGYTLHAVIFINFTTKVLINSMSWVKNWWEYGITLHVGYKGKRSSQNCTTPTCTFMQKCIRNVYTCRVIEILPPTQRIYLEREGATSNLHQY